MTHSSDQGTALVAATAAAPFIPQLNRWLFHSLIEGVVILRHQSAANPQPDNWPAILAATLRSFSSDFVALGAKRIAADGTLFSMGEFIIHPKGFHHLGFNDIQPTPATAFRFPEEVDAVTAGVLAIDERAFAAAGGINAFAGELGSLSFCLTLRRAGGRIAVAPQVVVTDTTTLKPSPTDEQFFRGRWHFDWNAPDLDDVRRHHASTGLFWNVRFHASALPFEKYQARPAVHWNNYQTVEPYRQRADHFVKLVRSVVQPRESTPAESASPISSPPLPLTNLLDLGCGDGLFSHLFAHAGLKVTGVDCESLAIDQARAKVAEQKYAAGAQPPAFIAASIDQLPFQPAQFDLAVMLDVIEHLPNPVRVLRHASRFVRPQGHLVLSTPAWQLGSWSDAIYHVTEFTGRQLINLVNATGCWEVQRTGMITGIYRDLIVVAKKI